MPRCGSCGKSWSQWRSLSLTSCSGMEGRGCCSWWSSVRVSVGCTRSPLICDFPRFELPQAGITDHLIGVGTNNAQKYVHLDLARGLYNILMILKHLLHNHSGSTWPMRRRSRPGGSSAEMGRGQGLRYQVGQVGKSNSHLRKKMLAEFTKNVDEGGLVGGFFSMISWWCWWCCYVSHLCQQVSTKESWSQAVSNLPLPMQWLGNNKGRFGAFAF